LRNSLLELFSLSLSHCIGHQLSFGELNVCSFCTPCTGATAK
jgi:hypothetical protein